MKRALRRYHDSKENDVEKGDAPSCLEDQVCNDSTTQNWLRDKIFNTSNSINKLVVGVTQLERVCILSSHNVWTREGEV